MLPALLLFLFASGIAAAPLTETTVFPWSFPLSDEALEELDADPQTMKLTYRRSNYWDLVGQRRSANANAQPGFLFDFMISFPFSIGTDAETPYFLIMETGVNKAFVFDKDYNGQRRPQAPAYDASKSGSSVPVDDAFSVISGGCLATGKTYQEDMFFFFDNKINQNMGAVTEFNFTHVYPEDGVYGLGWNPTLNTQAPGPTASPAINMAAAFGRKEVVFTLYTEEHGAGLAWGRVLPGDALPVHSAGGQAAITVDKIEYGDIQIAEKTSAIINTGHSTVALPSALYRQVLKSLQPKVDADTGLLVVECGDRTVRPPKFTFTIGGVEYDVRQVHYVIDKDFPGEICALAVSESADGNIHLGMPFVRTVAVTFNVSKNQIVLVKNTLEEP